MMEGQQHINPWAEKLSQVSLPDSGQAWIAMEALLNRKMPAGWKRDSRRWFLLILLLLLLIGVCNCPGRRWFGARSTTPVSVLRTTPAATPTPARMPATVAPPASLPRPDPASRPTPARGTTTDLGTTPANPASSRGIRLSSTHNRYNNKATRPPHRSSQPEGAAGTGLSETNQSQPTSPNANPDRPAAPDADSTRPTSPNATPAPPASAKKNDSLSVPARRPVSKDSIHKKPVTPSKQPKVEEKNESNNGWMVGIGLNQFFMVGGQQASSFNSGGITGTLSDYIPVPMVRYYFSPKLYVQLEAQINTPQYTKKNLVAFSTPSDSIGVTPTNQVIRTQTTVAINKLFYFNIPLSVHYTVFDHLDLGGGLQYSRLTNGIGVFNNNIDTGSNNSLTVETKSFKGDTIYKRIKTYEFRFLVDVNYTWQHFIFGIRYNQALSQFIHVEISPGQVTQARNSSLQLYLRYILFDSRKKKPLLPAK